MKIRPKRTKPLQKAWYILQPFFIFMIAKTIGMLILSYLAGYYLNDEQQSIYASLINAIASIFGVAFVMKDFLIEVCTTGEVDIDANGFVRFFVWIKKGIKDNTNKLVPLGACMSLAITASITFNILIELLSVKSEKYDNVSTIQYAIPFWIGLILYGVISPWVEEIVFRGLIFNRMKRYYKLWPSVIVSAVVFGCFHANLTQFIYGTIMGILIALVYEWTGTFEGPILFHATANIFVYILTTNINDVTSLISPLYLIIFLILSVLLTACLIITSNKKNRGC